MKKYQNGNYNVKIYSDGTKIRYGEVDEFISQFPENIDLKITNYCDGGCDWCHENSSINGRHANLNHDFIYTLRPGTELAIGGGNALSHPDLDSFLNLLKTREIISNLTVNQIHFNNAQNYLQKLIDEQLIYGLGISYNYVDERVIDFAIKNKNVVLHIIEGIANEELIKSISDKGIKILILGYKYFGRGVDFYDDMTNDHDMYINDHILDMFDQFDIVSFDNLAIENLSIQDKVSKDVWETNYMGDDGQFTMYIDLVNEKFAMNSTSKIRYDLKSNIDDMFEVVKNENMESTDEN